MAKMYAEFCWGENVLQSYHLKHLELEGYAYRNIF
jgi:hypothetical protein